MSKPKGGGQRERCYRCGEAFGPSRSAERLRREKIMKARQLALDFGGDQ